MIKFSVNEILAMNEADLKELRAEVAQAQPEGGGLPSDAYLDFTTLMDALIGSGPGRRFEELGGKGELERAILRLNAMDFEE